MIALSLLEELARQGRTVLHATGSKAFTHTLRQVANKGSTRTKSLSMYSNGIMTAEKNGLDVLILEEAHRIRAQSVNRYTPKPIRAVARPQIEELLDAARVRSTPCSDESARSWGLWQQHRCITRDLVLREWGHVWTPLVGRRAGPGRLG